MAMLKRIAQFLVIFSILLIILGRMHLAFIRYFDPDEMSHMHWAWLVATGSVPFRDFFFYNLPGYQYLIAWPFFLPPGSYVLIVTRLWQLLMYLLSALLLHRITKKLTGSAAISLLAVFIYLTFPMTFDKTIDIRPDISMMLLYLYAVDLIINNVKWTRMKLVLVGLSVSLSVFITLKTIIFAMPALIYLYLTHKPKPKFNQMTVTFLGLIAPAFIFFTYLVVTGALPNAFTMVLKDGFAVSAGKVPFSPWKALSPWPLVYLDAGGDSWPWRVNTAIWITAALGMFLFARKRFRESIFLLIFYASGIAFLFLFPAPYLQYFVPLSVFAATLSAYFLDFLFTRVGHVFHSGAEVGKIAALTAVLVCLLVSFYQQYTLRISPKFDDSEQLGVITDILRLTRPDERFYDMVGSYIFRPDGYIICCHPYAEFVDRLSFKVPTLRDSLIQTQTKFLLMDRTAMVFWQPAPEDLAFLKSHYLVSDKNWKIYPHGYKFGCSGGECIQVDIDNKPVTGNVTDTFYIIADDKYRITTFPAGQTVTIDNTVYGDQTVNEFNTGNHIFHADDAVQTFIIQLDR